jgi:hypothetical protein
MESARVPRCGEPRIGRPLAVQRFVYSTPLLEHIQSKARPLSDSSQIMSHQQDGSAGIDESDLAPTQTAGYRVGQQKTIDELKNLDKDDEALNRWKQSLLSGPGADAAAGGKAVVRRYQPNREGPHILTPGWSRLHTDHAGRAQATLQRPPNSHRHGSIVAR